MIIEIYTDASMKQFESGKAYGCSGALCATTGDSVYQVIPDTTNNKAELIAIYMGVVLANDIRMKNPEVKEIHLYSDSQFGIFGLTKWIDSWIKTTDENGIMYGSNKQPVKNQEYFAMILSYLVNNNLPIHFHHMAGHVRYSSRKMLMKANDVFYKSNGYHLRPEEIYKISYYNDIVDKTSRAKLENVKPFNNYMPSSDNNNLIGYTIPKDFRQFVH